MFFERQPEAALNTLWNFLHYMEEYFTHIGAEHILQGNNATIMQIKRRITNDAFVYLMPYVNTSESGVGIRPKKA